MKNRLLILAALLGMVFTQLSMAFADSTDNKKMSAIQHCKHMGGLHHSSEDER